MPKRYADRGVAFESWGAQIGFRQESATEWSGTLINRNAIDRHYGEPAHSPEGRRRYMCRIIEHSPTNFELITQGRFRGGRRHQRFGSLDAAQQAAVEWARRRFYVDEVVPEA